MSSILSINPDFLEEIQPRSSPPWVWFGFIFAAAFFAEEFAVELLGVDLTAAKAVLVLIALGGWIYWLFCVHRFHKLLREISRNHYSITGAEAVAKHFIPFYNLVWIFKWPATISDYLNQRGRVKMVSGHALGAALLISTLVSRFFDGGVGLTGVFIVGMYISGRLRKHLELLKHASPAMLPPPPDPGMFQSSSPEVAPAPLEVETSPPTSYHS